MKRNDPIAFSNFEESLRYSSIEGNEERDLFIRTAVIKPMSEMWARLLSQARKELPGLGRESRTRTFYWPHNPFTPVVFELVPNRSFYPYIGLPGPQSNDGSEEHCLVVGLSLSPIWDYRKEATGLTSFLTVGRARPAKALETMWHDRHEDMVRLFHLTGLKATFRDHHTFAESDGLDAYFAVPRRRHWLRLSRNVAREQDIRTVSAGFLALARLYHVLQGFIRGDRTRVDFLCLPQAVSVSTVHAVTR